VVRDASPTISRFAGTPTRRYADTALWWLRLRRAMYSATPELLTLILLRFPFRNLGLIQIPKLKIRPVLRSRPRETSCLTSIGVATK